MKKRYILLFLAILCSISIGFSGCSKKNKVDTEKENLITYNSAVADWLLSPHFMANLKKYVKHAKDLDGYLDYCVKKIAKQHGYETEEEPVKLFEKYKKDPQVIKAVREAESRTAGILKEIAKYRVYLTNNKFSMLTKIVDSEDLRIKRDMARDDDALLLENEAQEANLEGISPDSLNDKPLSSVSDSSKCKIDSTNKKTK